MMHAEAPIDPVSVAFVVSTTGRRPIELEAALRSVDEHAPGSQKIVVVQRGGPDLVRTRAGRAGWEAVADDGVGSCRARNVGLGLADRPWIQFLDDDAVLVPWWAGGPSVDVAFGESDVAAVAMTMVDAVTGRSLIRFPREPQQVTARNVWRTVIEPAVVLRRRALLDIGGWEETLGVGVRFESEEGIDLVVRLVDEGWRVRYVPALSAFHPTPDVVDVAKKRRYGRGSGRLARLHPRSTAVWWYVIGSAVAPVVVPYRRGMDRSRFAGRWARSFGIVEGVASGGRLPRRLADPTAIERSRERGDA